VDLKIYFPISFETKWYKYIFGTQTFSKNSIWYPNIRNVQFDTQFFKEIQFGHFR